MTNQTPSMPQAVLTDAEIDRMRDRFDWEGFTDPLIATRVFCRDLERAILSRMGGEAVPAWQPIETAPKSGVKIIAYRPLAHLTHDPNISIVTTTPRDRGCWEETVPMGMDSSNFTSGYCKATHWQPLPAAPTAPAQQAADVQGERHA